MNCWRSARVSIIDNVPYLTFGANATATCVVLYTMHLLHALQVECKLDKKLTKNNAKIGIGSQCVTTFLGKEDINYLVTAFKHNDDTSDLHFSQTIGANKILKNFVLPGLIIRAEVVQKNLTLYTATTKKQFHNVCGIVPGTQGSEVK